MDSDTFERQKSKRWVKADVPSYGDEWADEYGDYDYDEAEENPAEVELLPAAPLVLSIDKMQHSNSSDDDDDDDDEAYLAPGAVHTEPPTVEETLAEEKFLFSENPATHATHSSEQTGHSQNLQSEPRSEPQSQSEPQSAPQADVQSESQSELPFGHEPAEREHSYEAGYDEYRNQSEYGYDYDHPGYSNGLLPPTPTFSTHNVPSAPDTPISERSFNSDADSIQREPTSLNVRLNEIREVREESPEVPQERPDAPKELVLSIDRMNLDSDDLSIDDARYDVGDVKYNESAYEEAVAANHAPVLDSSDDDWGYNSANSSNDELDKIAEEPEKVENERELAVAPKHETARSPRPVQTDALDLLINDLSQMERLLTVQSKQAQPAKLEQKQAPSADSGNLPSLSSMYDISLPDFDNHSFTSDAHPEPVAPPSDFAQLHQTFMTNALSRLPSIRKAPPVAADASRLAEGSTLEPVVSTGSISTGKASFDAPTPVLPPPPAKKDEALSRHDSTVSYATFNMGSWKPNTNVFRDQFVNENDNESQMAMSVFEGTDGNYSKFTGLNPPSNYNEAYASSSLSVPSTIDKGLDRINEDESDDDHPEVMSMRTSEPNTSNDLETTTSAPSVFKDQPYSAPKFKEEKTAESLIPEVKEEEEEEKRVPSGSSATKSLTASSTQSTLKVPANQKYPVFSWKNIMAVSQPVDRIHLLKKARADEMAYDTGLAYWLNETLRTAEVSPNIHIGKLAAQAYQNAQHSDIRRHTSIRSRVNLVRDKMDSGNLGALASNFGRKFLSRGKKLMKSGSD